MSISHELVKIIGFNHDLSAMYNMKEKELSTNLLIFQGREKLQPKPLAFKQREDTREG